METLANLKLTPYGDWIVAGGAGKIQIGDGGVGRADYDGPPIAEYTDGVSVVSMIPLGQLVWLVHFEDEPQVFYAVFNSHPERDPVETARVWRGAH